MKLHVHISVSSQLVFHFLGKTFDSLSMALAKFNHGLISTGVLSNNLQVHVTICPCLIYTCILILMSFPWLMVLHCVFGVYFCVGLPSVTLGGESSGSGPLANNLAPSNTGCTGRNPPPEAAEGERGQKTQKSKRDGSDQHLEQIYDHAEVTYDL